MKAQVKRRFSSPQELAATNMRDFRTFLLVAQFEARAIGARIKQAREVGGMTQEDLAAVASFSKRSLQDYENGVTIPYKHLKEIGRLLDRPSDWFLYGDQPEGESSATPPDAQELLQEMQEQRSAIEALTAAVDSLTAAVEEALLPARRVPARRRRAS